MQEVVLVEMGEARVTRRATEVLVAHGLGSCIALCARDPAARVAGMAHIVLPRSPGRSEEDPSPPSLPARFADRAVPFLFQAMEREGAATDRLKIAVVGAARIFADGEAGLDIGGRNAAAVLHALKERGVRLLAHDLGGTFGRVCRLFAGDGRVLVRTIGSGERELAVLDAQDVGAGAKESAK